jgi:hypothetical protein
MEALLGVGRVATRFCCTDEEGERLIQQPRKALGAEPSAVTVEEDAHRLSKAMGCSLAAIIEALPGLNRCVARRLPGRRVYKPLDLAVLTTFVKTRDGQELLKNGGEDHEWAADLEDELSALTPAARGEIERVLRRAHLCGGYLPKIGQGCAGLHEALPSAEHAPIAHSYDHGCRFFAVSDPFVGSPLEHMHDYQAIASELRDKDFSAAVYTGLLNPVGLGKRGAEGVAASIALHRERLVSTGCTSKEGHVGRQESKGQPFLDCYMALSALGMGPGMAPDATLQLDVVWRAMEDLIYDGTVRSIGICNVTLLQLEALLRMPSLRIRPASVSIEHHPYVGCAALDAFLEYANVQRIAVFAHTPLAQGTHLEEDERLRQSVGLSPAQATLRFSLDKGLSVTPGALTLAHIAENLATPLDVTPPALPPLEGGVVTAWPLAVIPKWSSYIAMNGGGALADDEEGHVCATILSSEELVGATAKALLHSPTKQAQPQGDDGGGVGGDDGDGDGGVQHSLARISAKHTRRCLRS